MKYLYIDCGMGAAGDILAAALLDLVDDKEGMLRRLNDTGIPGVQYKLENSVKCGVSGNHLSVLIDGAEEGVDEHNHEHEHNHVHEYSHEHEHSHGHSHEHEHHHEDEHDHSHEHRYEHHHHDHVHRSLGDIRQIAANLNISDSVRENLMAVYRLIAEAEGRVHGRSVEEIHFHEVGNLDAIADITAVCMLMEEIKPDRVYASPVHTGSGSVNCAHGILPVPAPATALLLKGIPSYSADINGELCTPTGAALLRYFVNEFGSQPVMSVENIGYGMGKKDFKRANLIRASIGSTVNRSGEVIELVCNLDDMSAEDIGFAFDRLMDAGALDVFTQYTGMKKNRPGTLLTCICREEKRQELIECIFKHTSTIGIRESICKRYELERRMDRVSTEFGNIGIKISGGYGTCRIKYEYNDLARIASETGKSLDEIRKTADMQRG